MSDFFLQVLYHAVSTILAKDTLKRVKVQ